MQTQQQHVVTKNVLLHFMLPVLPESLTLTVEWTLSASGWWEGSLSSVGYRRWPKWWWITGAWWQSWCPRVLTRILVGTPGEPRLIILHKLQRIGHNCCVYEFNSKVKRCSRLCQGTQNQEVSPAQLPLQSAVGLESSCLCRESNQLWELCWVTASPSARYSSYALFITWGK